MSWDLKDILFAHPSVLYLLLLLPLLVGWYAWRMNRQQPALALPDTGGLRKAGANWRTRTRHLLFALRLVSLSAFLVALARPQVEEKDTRQETYGIDIVLALDVSPSMLARDFSPNRLEAAREVALRFIKNRPSDRIGLVVFSGEAFTQCPVTIDHRVLSEQLKTVQAGKLESGTAIGSGLGTAVNRLKDSKAASKVIILLTDGVNNTGSTDPRMAADLAASFGIRVHTIGVGSRGTALSPVGIYPNGQYIFERVPVEIDEELLKDIAAKTGGQYYRATGNTSLQEIYDTIDQMERTRIEMSVIPRKRDLFFPLLLIGAAAMLLEFLFRKTLYRTIE